MNYFTSSENYFLEISLEYRLNTRYSYTASLLGLKILVAGVSIFYSNKSSRFLHATSPN